MTREEIIKMARACGAVAGSLAPGLPETIFTQTIDLERFFHMAQAAEREACAKVCEDSVPTYFKNGERWLKGERGKPDVRLKDIAPNLEAAWEAEQLLKNGSVLESYSVQHQCAAAIRARGNT